MKLLNATGGSDLHDARGGMAPPEINLYMFMRGSHANTQVVTIGANSSVGDIVFNPVQLQPSAGINLIELATSLLRLRETMQQEDTEREHSTEIECITQAEIKSREGNEIAALRLLKAAGHWALEIAEKAGFEIAALTIARAIQT